MKPLTLHVLGYATDEETKKNEICCATTILRNRVHAVDKVLGKVTRFKSAPL